MPLINKHVVLCLFLLLGCTARFANALEIVYPADKTVVSRSDFLIIKGGEKPAFEALIVEINGSATEPIAIDSPEYKAAFADFLILEPAWDAGKNTLIVRGIANGKEAASARAEIFFRSADDPAAIMPPGFKPFVMHLPEKESLCAPCHNMKPTPAQLKSATGDNPCASCHKRMLARKFVHGPEGVFQCSDCHSSDSKPARWQVTKPILSLCGECHTDKIDEFRKSAFVHGPVAVGDCTICHDPHAAEQPAQLVAPVNPLCLGCHSDVLRTSHVLRGVGGKGHPLDKVRDPSNPERTLSCVSCHNPHGGAAKSFFRKGATSYFNLCQICHKK